MSTISIERDSSLFSGLNVPVAGDLSKNAVKATKDAIEKIKFKTSARTSFAYNDLHSLAAENDIIINESQVFILANRFLFALPTYLPKPELALDSDGEISFDWMGINGQVLTATLRGDGRLSYAARISALDKDYGTKIFSDSTPKELVELLLRVTKK